MNEEKIDYRKQSPEEVYAVKKTIIQQYKRGLKTAEIQKNTGMCIDTVRKTIHDYKKGGMAAIKPRKEGRPKGTGMKLTEEQCKRIQALIIDKDPDQLKMPFALWTRKAVKELIKRQFGIDLPIRTVGDYLKRWGFTPQKPAKVSRHQDSAAVKEWLNETYPAVREQAKGAEVVEALSIYCEDIPDARPQLVEWIKGI